MSTPPPAQFQWLFFR